MKLRCMLGVHFMPKWTTIDKWQVASPSLFKPDEKRITGVAHTQERTCSQCGATQLRVAKATLV